MIETPDQVNGIAEFHVVDTVSENLANRGCEERLADTLITDQDKGGSQFCCWCLDQVAEPG